MPRNLSDSFFGSIALKNRMLSHEQLTQALRVQWERARGGNGPTLGEVCRQLGFLREDEVNAIVWAQAKSEVMLEDALTGQICLRNRLLTRAQLEEALEDQRALDFTVRLGDLLCQKGFLDRQQLHAVLTAQNRMKSGRQKPWIEPPERPREPPAGWAPGPIAAHNAPARGAATKAAKRAKSPTVRRPAGKRPAAPRPKGRPAKAKKRK
jgi:hypothetical protein